jgi:hypothetical protein
MYEMIVKYCKPILYKRYYHVGDYYVKYSSIVATSPDVSCGAMAPGPGGHGYIAPFPFRPSSASSAPSRGDELITGTTEVHGGFIISTLI